MPLIKDTGTCREDDIRERAYRIYEARVRDDRPGDPLQDWCQAEREVTMEAKLYRAVD